MKTVWKFQLIDKTQMVQLTQGAQILSVQIQKHSMMMWVLLDPEAPEETVVIEQIDTGTKVEDVPREYITTVQFRDGAYVTHIFKRLP